MHIYLLKVLEIEENDFQYESFVYCDECVDGMFNSVLGR